MFTFLKGTELEEKLKSIQEALTAMAEQIQKSSQQNNRLLSKTSLTQKQKKYFLEKDAALKRHAKQIQGMKEFCSPTSITITGHFNTSTDKDKEYISKRLETRLKKAENFIENFDKQYKAWDKIQLTKINIRNYRTSLSEANQFSQNTTFNKTVKELDNILKKVKKIERKIMISHQEGKNIKYDLADTKRAEQLKQEAEAYNWDNIQDYLNNKRSLSNTLSDNIKQLEQAQKQLRRPSIGVILLPPILRNKADRTAIRKLEENHKEQVKLKKFLRELNSIDFPKDKEKFEQLRKDINTHSEEKENSRSHDELIKKYIPSSTGAKDTRSKPKQK